MERQLSQQEAEKQVSDILSRGVGTFIDPDNKFRQNLIAKATGKFKKDIIIKFGVDPTRPDIHLGHAVVLRKLRQLQDLGCKVIFLAGDFTAMIGDPTGKNKTRPEADQQAIGNNIATYIKQIPKILKIEPDENERTAFVKRDPDQFVVDSPWFGWMRNAEWFSSVSDITTEGASNKGLTIKNLQNQEFTVQENSFVGKAVLYENTRMQKVYLNRPQTRSVSLMNALSVLRHVSYAQLIERDMFQERIKNKEPFFMHEMLYPVFQGIDSDVIAEIYGSCDLEVGGTDQTFNMLMGRTVMEMTKKAPQSVLSFELLVGLDGKEKMSKSLDNYVGITDTPGDMFGKIMSIPDSAIASYYELCTFTPLSDIEVIKKKLSAGKVNPRDVKMDLAEQIVDMYHAKSAGKTAREHFVETFQRKELPSEIPTVKTTKGAFLVDVLIDADVIDSKSEFRRLMSSGAIRKDGEQKLTDPAMRIESDLTLKIGKHRFIKIVVQ